MANLTKRITIFLATALLGTALMGSAASAAQPTSDLATVTRVSTDVAQTLSVDGTRPDGDHHRRFCVKLNTLLTRLVDNGVITREQKLRIMDAFNCVPDPSTDRPATTDRPSTTRPTAVRPTAAQ
jgi:hypothetical protein